MLSTKVDLLKIQRPSGFFRMLLNLMGSPRFAILGLFGVVVGMAFCRLPELDWTIGAGDLCLSLGSAVLLVSYLRLFLLETGYRRGLLGVLSFGLLSLCITHQNNARSIKGQVLLSDGPVETLAVRRTGVSVDHHLGSPLQLDETSEAPGGLIYGFEDPLIARIPSSTDRSVLGPWFVEHLGLGFRDASLTVTVAVQHQAEQWQTMSFRTGGVQNLSDGLTLRLVSTTAMPTGEGHRLKFEIIKDGERSMRTVYDESPNLDQRLGLALPYIRVDAVNRAPVNQLYLYSRNQNKTVYGLLLAGAFVILLGFAGRVR